MTTSPTRPSDQILANTLRIMLGLVVLAFLALVLLT